MDEEFVVGFMSDDPDGLTPIDVVADVTGLTIKEVRSCCEVVKKIETEIPEPETL